MNSQLIRESRRSDAGQRASKLRSRRLLLSAGLRLVGVGALVACGGERKSGGFQLNQIAGNGPGN